MVNKTDLKSRLWKMGMAGFVLTVVLSGDVFAGEESLTLDHVKQGVDTVWVSQGFFLIGDGKIFVLDLAECVRIRTGDEGRQAIG
jgi:hypothetical protein